MADTDNHAEVAYKPVVLNPLCKKDKKKTDHAGVFLLGFVIFICIVMSTYGFLNTPEKYREPDSYSQLTDFLYLVQTFPDGLLNFARNFWDNFGLLEKITFILSHVILSFIFILLLHCIPKLFTFIGVILLLASMIYPFFILDTMIKSVHGDYKPEGILKHATMTSTNPDNLNDFIYKCALPLINIMFIIPSIICVMLAGVGAVSKLIRKTIRAILFFRSFILFYILIVIMEMLLMAFLVAINLFTNLTGFTLYISFIGSAYICFFMYYFGRAVVARTIASWHYTEAKEEISTTVFKSIGSIWRFNMGTVAIGATLILPIFIAIRVACVHTIEKSGCGLLPRIFKLYLIGNITNYSLTLTSIHNCSFCGATRKAYYLLVKSYSLSLGFMKIFSIVIKCIAGLVCSLSILLVYIIHKGLFNYNFEEMQYQMIAVIGLLSLPLVMICEAAADTTLLYTLEKCEADKSIPMETLPDTPSDEQAV